MPSPFETVTLDQARRWITALSAPAAPPLSRLTAFPLVNAANAEATEALRDAQTPLYSGIQTDWLLANRLFMLGDHWQNGTAWIGPVVDAKSEFYEKIMRQIRRAFVSQNAIGEVASRHMSGVLGHEPSWGFTVRRDLADGEELTTEEQALIDEAESLLTQWFDRQRAHSLLQAATLQLLWATRAPLRLYVPEGKTVDGQVPQVTLQKALDYIFLEAPDVAQAVVVADRATMEQAGVFSYQRFPATLTASDFVGEGTQPPPVNATTDSGAALQYVELSYRDDESTVLRSLNDKGVEQEAKLALGGHLTIYEMRRAPLITEQIRQNQKLLNLALTMLQRNSILGGFLERVFANAQEPGHWEYDADFPSDKSRARWVVDAYQVGAGTTNFLMGQPIYDAQGQISGYTTPVPHYRDPVPVDTFVETARVAYENILQEAQQLYALITRDATSSGESRKQAMADYLISLRVTAPVVESAGRWLLETVLSMVAQFAGQTGRYDGLRATFDCRLNAGPVPALEMEAVLKMVEGGVLSRETGMSRLGVDDTDAEASRLLAEQEASLTMKQDKATITQALSAAGAGIESAATVAGFSEEEAKLLAKGDFAPPREPVAPPAPANGG